MKNIFIKGFLFFAAIMIAQNYATAQVDAWANQPTPELTNNFYAKWTVSPTHAPMDGATGLGKIEAAENAFGNMGILVRFNSTGNIDVRNGTSYEALAALAYEADSVYTIEVRADVKTQTYSVDVTPAGGSTVTLATDYEFRVNNVQDTLRYLSMVVNEIVAFGGVPGSRLNPSWSEDPITSDSYELNLANNDDIPQREGSFKATFDMMPTAQAIDAVFSFSNGAIPVQGYGGMSAILRCNQGGKIDARDGTGYSSENDIFYVAGTTYSVVMNFDIAAQTYSATVTPEGGSATVIADNYGFRAAADTLNNVAKLIGTGGAFGGEPGDLVISNLVFGDPFDNQPTPNLTNLFYSKWTVQPTHSPMDGATGFGKTEAGAQQFGNMGILVRFNSNGFIDARNGTSYEALEALTYDADSIYTIEVRADVKTQTYSVDVTPAGGSAVTIGTDYEFRVNNPQDTLNYFSMVVNEIEAFGGVPGSRLNPSWSDDPITGDSYELNLANNDDTPLQDGTFKASFDMMPTAQAIDGVFSFSNGAIPVQGYGGMSAILRCNQGGKIDARDGTGYSSENDIFYVAGTTYSVVMNFDVAAQSYSVTVTPEGGSPTVIADNYAFRAAADTLNNVAKLIGIGGAFGGVPGDLVISNLVFGDPFANEQTPALTDLFYSKWTVQPTHSPMDGATGFGKTEAGAQQFGNMGILVRFNSNGFIDARNGTSYEALEALTYDADSIYTIEVTANVKAQTYSVDVTPAGGSAVTIGTDYEFRVNNPQDTLNNFSMVINELEQFGGVPGSRLNPTFSDDPFTSDSYELNMANNDDIAEQDGSFTATFNMMPTAQTIDAAFSFSNGSIPIQGYSGMSAILRCNQGGKIDARDGTGYSSENDLFYVAGTTYGVVMDFDVAAQTYSAVVTPEGGSSMVIAADYAFRAAADTLNNTAKLIGIGGAFGGQPGDLVITDLELMTTSVIDVNAPEFSMSPNPAHDELIITFGEEVQLVEVYDNLGRKLIENKTNGSMNATLDISRLQKGVYLLNVSSAKGSGSKLFIKH